MPKAVVARRSKKKTSETTLIVRLDKKSKALLKTAAEMRGISASDFVRIVATEQARREVEGAKNNVIVMTPDEQLAFWNALNERTPLTDAQRRLGATMRGEM
jgi:uncharacterized protein (DUF1778 family)